MSKKSEIAFFSAVKTLTKSIREYKKPSLLAPLFVALEVVMECFIPYVMTLLLGAIEYISLSPENPNRISVLIVDWLFKNGEKNLLTAILFFGGVLLVIAFISLIFGALSGRFCAVASSGFAKNLRKDMYYNVQKFSFSNKRF